MFTASVVLAALGAALDAFSLLLLIPFLRSLFGMGAALPEGGRNAAERFVDGVVGGILGDVEGLEGLRVVCLLVLVTIILKNAAMYGSRVLSIRVQEYLVRDVRDDVHAHLQRLPLAFFERERTGQLIARVVTDTRDAKLVPESLAQGVRHLASALAYVAALAVLSWRLTLLALVLVPPMLLVLRPILRHLRIRFRRVFDDQGEILGALQETVSGIRMVKSYAAEDYEQERFAERSHGYSRAFVKSATLAHAAAPLSEILSSLVAVGLVWIGAGMVLGSATLGPEQFLVFVTIALRAISPIKAISQTPALAQQGLAAADRFFDILERSPEPAGGDRRLEGFERGIRYERVDFAYDDGRPVLSEVDFEIGRGEIVALVGPSGGGKSTLVDLLPRFADPTSGRILIDGVDIRDLSVSSLRRTVGIVSQETTIFHESVAANIAYGEPGRPMRDIEAAARAAHAHEFILGLPDGYETELGDRGVRLSGGQRQRIGLARAIFRDTPILVLDEATSALDAGSEREIQEALEELFRGRTVIVIAHRLSTVREAARILVLEEGRIVDEGTHDDLLAREGPYLRLFERQLEPVARAT